MSFKLKLSLLFLFSNNLLVLIQGFKGLDGQDVDMCIENKFHKYKYLSYI